MPSPADLEQARTLEARGEVEAAAKKYLVAGRPQDAARVYHRAGRFRDAAHALVEGYHLHLDGRSFSPTLHAAATMAARLFSAANEPHLAAALWRSLGQLAKEPSLTTNVSSEETPAAPIALTNQVTLPKALETVAQGHLVDDRYRVEALLGAGGMATLTTASANACAIAQYE